MRVSKEAAVAICQDYGFATADGWSDVKLVKKLGELIKLERSGEFELENDKLADVLKQLVEADKAKELLEIGDGEEAEFEEADEQAEEGSGSRFMADDEDEDAPVEGCPLGIGDRVLVCETVGDEWKGIVNIIHSKDYVEVRDQKGETWDVAVGKCELKMKASEVSSKAQQRQRKPPKDEEEAEMRSLQERIRALKAKRKGNSGEKNARAKKLRRDEIAVRVLRAHPEGGVLEHLVEEVEARWKKQGRRENLKASTSTLSRLVKAGVLFGLLKVEGRRILWTDSE